MRLSTCSTALSLALLATGAVSAQQPVDNHEKQEFAVSIGALSGTSPNATGGPLALGSGVAFQANYAHKFRELPWANFYGEIDALYSPVRHLSGTPTAASSAIHSVYATPGVKLQFTPKEVLSPYLVGGAGYAYYDSSGTSLAGGPTPAAAGSTNTYAVDFGAGVDYAVNKRYVLRGEVRGFYTGRPNLGVTATGGEFNLVISGGIVWRMPK